MTALPALDSSDRELPNELSAFSLRAETPKAWVSCVMQDLDAFLLDHASCERKASSLAMSLVSRYPDRHELVEAMIAIAREELEHFHIVTRLLHQRGLTLMPDEKDLYINLLQIHCRHGRDERLIDRLVLSSVVEARGFERLTLLVDALRGHPLEDFMARFMASESGHRKVFLRLAEFYFPRSEVAASLDRFLDLEAAAMLQVPIRPAFH